MPEASWCIFNVIVGIPVAVVLLGLCREILRALLALAFGFRVFEMKWGAGRRVWAKPIGPLEIVLGMLPLVGSIIAESGSPKYHRIGRLSQAGGPVLIQLAFAGWAEASGQDFSQALRSNFAPIAALYFANIFLIGLHVLIPFETNTGFRTDIRSIFDISFGRAETNRRARASYYARLAHHWLERADVEQAKTVLERGLTQLGHNSLLKACEARILAEDLSSVIDQSDCSDALRALIENAEPRRRRERGTWSRPERIRQAAVTALPLVLVAIGMLAIESERLSRLMQERLIETGNAVAADGIASACKLQLTRWERWSTVLDLGLATSPETQRDQHDHLARLERCRGRGEAAAAHQSLAISAAQRAVTQPLSRVDSDPGRWLENEVRLSAILRQAAELDGDRGRYRHALATLGRATQGLELAQNQVATSQWHEFEIQARANRRLEGEKTNLELTRLQVLTRMGAR